MATHNFFATNEDDDDDDSFHYQVLYFDKCFAGTVHIDTSNKNLTFFFSTTGKWYSSDCDYNIYAVICTREHTGEHPPPKTDPPPVPVPGYCPKDFFEIGN